MRCVMRYPLLLSLAVVVSGCSGSDGPPVPLYPVTGKVTYNGKPVAGADITFFNKEADRSAFGRTNGQGEYQLTTFSSNDGAVAGKSIVTIVKFAAPTEPTDVAPVTSTAYVPPTGNQSTDPPQPESEFPEKYGNQTTSGLVAVVRSDAPNEINFDLEN